jgi:release factor glutamine methyltransferase
MTRKKSWPSRKVSKMPGTWTIARVVEWTEDYFNRNNLSESRIDAELLLSHVLNCKRLDLYLKKDEEIGKRELAKFKQLIVERKNRKPVSYITGEREFMGLSFKVNSGTLIPRPETELLVEEAVKLIKKRKLSLVLEIGTGSGNIAVSIAKLAGGVKVFSSDASLDALRVAQGNADAHGVADRVVLKHGDLFEALRGEGLEGAFDMIVSNPPYIADDEKAALAPELSFEPSAALFGGGDGLDFYRSIAGGAGNFLKQGGFLLFELNSNRSAGIQQITAEAGYKIEKIIKDYSNLERVLTARSASKQ